MNGYEFVRELRADPSYRHARVCSTQPPTTPDEVHTLAESLGVSRILVKPSEPEEILRVVAEALEVECRFRAADGHVRNLTANNCAC